MRLLKEPRLEAPELVVPAWASDPAPLGAMRGRVVLLDFFSFGDPEGMRSLRWMRALGDRYRDARFTVVGIHVPAYSFERPVETARREVWRLGIPYPVALDPEFAVFRAYENRDLPARFLVDARGTVRGWHHGAGGRTEIEGAVRALLREARPDAKLPPALDPLPGDPRPGRPQWLATSEIRFGTRGVGFGTPEADGGGTPATEGEDRTFDAPPEMRAEGRPYLRGAWRLHEEGVASRGPGGLSIVFEGAAVSLVLSRAAVARDGAGGDPEEDPPPVLVVSLDGGPVPEPWRGADVEGDEETSFVRVDRGSVYELVDGMPFGIHHLDLAVPGPDVALHLISFGTVDVPEED